MGKKEYLKECVILMIIKLRMFVKAAGEFAWLGLSRITPPILKTFKVFHKILLVRDVYPSYLQNISYWCNGNKERDRVTGATSMG